MHDIVIVAIDSPVVIGIYKASELQRVVKSNEKSSEFLPLFFSDFLKHNTIQRIVYAKGPGSFMAIKLSYIFLKTLAIVKNLEFYAVDAFYFNNNHPIKSIGNLCFIKENETISTVKCQNYERKEFTVPQQLDLADFTKDTQPLYHIGYL